MTGGLNACRTCNNYTDLAGAGRDRYGPLFRVLAGSRRRGDTRDRDGH